MAQLSSDPGAALPARRSAAAASESASRGNVASNRLGVWAGPAQAADDFSALLFALSSGILGLVVILRPLVVKGVDEPAEQRAFAVGFPVALVASLAIPTLVKLLQRKFLPGSRAFWPLLGALHIALWVLALRLSHLAAQ